jgi:hypothetical protein
MKQIIVFLFYLGTAFSQSKSIHVPADQPTIQAGINAARNGDTVIVHPGKYFDNINFRGKKIVLTSRYYESKDTSFIGSTIIDGSVPASPDSASVVRIVSHEDSSTVLQGFTITGGTGTNWIDEHGAGVYREGGGILIAGSSPVIKNNVLINNIVSKNSKVVSAGGGGIRAGDGNPKILNNVVIRNTGRYGAGIVLNYTGALVRNNIITQNSGGEDYGGGALWMNHDGTANKLIENNTLVGNKVIAVYVWQGSSIIRNCILWRDSSTSARQIAANSGGPTVTYSNVQGGWTGTGNSNVNPQFMDSSFHLGAGSPCIDAGDTNALFEDLADTLLPVVPDMARWPSQGGLRNDMGAYGGPGASDFSPLTILTDVVSSGSILPAATKLEQNYPNPFNPATTISYRLLSKAFVNLKVYDALGREVATLVSEVMPSGDHSVQWQADGLPSGVYFYRLQSKNTSETRKLILLK